LSPGFRSPIYTAILAGDPESGCTLTYSAPKSSFALSIASVSISSIM